MIVAALFGLFAGLFWVGCKHAPPPDPPVIPGADLPPPRARYGRDQPSMPTASASATST